MPPSNAGVNGMCSFQHINLRVESISVTTSQIPFFSEPASGHHGPPIPEAKRAYFQARLRNRLFNFIVEKFLYEQQRGLTKPALARRIGRTADVVNHLLGIGAEELKPETS